MFACEIVRLRTLSFLLGTLGSRFVVMTLMMTIICPVHVRFFVNRSAANKRRSITAVC